MNSGSTRRELIIGGVAAAVGTAVPTPSAAQTPSSEVELADLKAAEKLAGVEFTDEERKRVLATVRSLRPQYAAWRAAGIGYGDEPATRFTPLGGGSRPNARVQFREKLPNVQRPRSDEDLAFMTAREHAALISAHKLTSVELTNLYLARLKRYGPKLLNVVNLTEALAIAQAEAADAEIASGHYRGPLHGLPYGLKDLFAVRGYPTTWGANTFEHQKFDHDATVYTRLAAAGAVLVAKFSMGALALGDIWFGGQTKNPWNLSQGSSGSSAGSSSATAAGLVSFSIGTETLGSIMSPSMQCRVSGLRPTYGRVSRHGAMALSYTMDKVGPICRTLGDCAMVFAAICGEDMDDPSAVNRDFVFPARLDWKKLRVGSLLSDAVEATDPVTQFLKSKGVTILKPKFSRVPDGLTAILSVESASAFEEFTRTGVAKNLTNSPWAETFRAYRYVSGVDYLQAMRLRTKVMHLFEKELEGLDMVLLNGNGGPLLAMTNLTGHPQVHIPMGQTESNTSVGRSLVGRLYQDDLLVTVGAAIQEHLQIYRKRPDMTKI